MFMSAYVHNSWVMSVLMAQKCFPYTILNAPCFTRNYSILTVHSYVLMVAPNGMQDSFGGDCEATELA